MAVYPSHSPFSLSCLSRCLVGSEEESTRQSQCGPGSGRAWPCSHAHSTSGPSPARSPLGPSPAAALRPEGGCPHPLHREAGPGPLPSSPGYSTVTARPQEHHCPQSPLAHLTRARSSGATAPCCPLQTNQPHLQRSLAPPRPHPPRIKHIST